MGFVHCAEFVCIYLRVCYLEVSLAIITVTVCERERMEGRGESGIIQFKFDSVLDSLGYDNIVELTSVIYFTFIA